MRYNRTCDHAGTEAHFMYHTTSHAGITTIPQALCEQHRPMPCTTTLSPGPLLPPLSLLIPLRPRAVLPTTLLPICVTPMTPTLPAHTVPIPCATLTARPVRAAVSPAFRVLLRGCLASCRSLPRTLRRPSLRGPGTLRGSRALHQFPRHGV